MINMKKAVLFLAVACALVSCSSSEEGGEGGNSWLASAPATEVLMGVETLDNISKVDGMQMRASVNPLAPVVTVNYFNVKIDPRLGYNYPANNYVGVIIGGKLYKDCPFITINKGNNNSYLLSTNGSGLRTLIAAGDTATASILATINGKILRNQRISPTVVEKNIHVMWYLAKDMFNGWHIDGLLTDKADIKEACDACRDEGFKEITFGENGKQLTYEELMDSLPVNYNIKPLDKTLGVDIHQQRHDNWGEIKTSVHIKEAKDVKIVIPVGKDNTLENADTNEVARYFEKYYEIQNYNKTIGSTVNVKVERLTESVVINITGVTDELLKALERRYNDGFTVEIHTFYKLTDKNGVADFKTPVWNALKNSQVIYDGNMNGQITSAFFTDESVEIK